MNIEPVSHRSRCIFGLILGLAASAVATASATGSAGKSRPNILYIMSDDHAFQAISAYGSNRNQTPHIDRIAQEGMRFDRCYVTNSLCGPSRACILTGTYSHVNGMYDHYSKFNNKLPTFPKLLQKAGYTTAIIGKWHLTSDPAGFDHWEVLPGQGKYYRPDFISPDGKSQVDGYTTEIITEKSLSWLQEGRDPEKPFLLMVHHKAPHRPWEPAPAKLGPMVDKEFAEPTTLFDDYATRGRAAQEAEMRISQMRPDSDLKLWDRENRERTWRYAQMTPEERIAWERHVDPRLAKFAAAAPQGHARSRWFYQLYMRDYLGCIESVDDSVGKLLDYLDESGLAENTIVVYASDQGFYMGEHGWFDKRFMYEESLRTPLLIRWPGVVQPGSVDTTMVSNVDFAETFLDAAGIEVPERMQGRSFLPILTGDTPKEWRNSFYYHYYEGEKREHRVPKHEGVTTGDAKLMRFYTIGEWQMFDLKNDPQELRNVWDDPQYADLQEKLLAELVYQRDELGIPTAP